MTEMTIQQVQSDSSIEITKNTKGFTWSVKAYGATVREIEAKLKDLTASAKSTVDSLQQQA